MSRLSPLQRSLARHALGLPNPRKTTYRNHYVVGAGCADYDAWMAMVGYGFAKTRKGSELTGGDRLFWLTLEGALLAIEPNEDLDRDRFSRARAHA